MSSLSLSLWQEAIEKIKGQLPSQAYETWFGPTRAVSAADSELTLEVPNPFFRDWLVKHYSELIQKILLELCGKKVDLLFVFPSAASETKPDDESTAPWVRSEPAPAVRSTEGLLNSRYTFSEFVVGPSNRFAHAAAVAIGESPAKVYNPLFIYGGVGLGKTHLMQAIGHRIREKFPATKCLYTSSERFTNQLISAIQNRSMVSFRERFRSVDVLLVDDIHFISGKEATQEAFFHTFNALYDAHKQIVVSSDRSPKELHGVEERLVSRFEWGLVTDVQPPDLETRVAILRKKAQAQGTQVPDSITLFIAERITSNIRELEGALNRVIAYSVLTGREISPAMAQEVLKGMVAETAKHVTVDKIQRIVADYFNVSMADIKGKRRTKEVALPRQLAMALARELTDASFPAIGEAFGGRDHATVIYACNKVAEEYTQSGKIKELVDILRSEFNQAV